MKIFDFGIQVLSKSMSLRMEKHASIAANLANADTPGYRPKAVAFEERLQKAIESGNSSRINHVTSKTEIVDDRQPRLDGNSVSTDRQMAALTENTLKYTASADFLKRKIGMIKRTLV